MLIHYQAYITRDYELAGETRFLAFETVEEFTPESGKAGDNLASIKNLDAEIRFRVERLVERQPGDKVDIVAAELKPIELAEQVSDDDDYILPLKTVNGKLVLLKFPKLGMLGHPTEDEHEYIFDVGLNLVTNGHYT